MTRSARSTVPAALLLAVLIGGLVLTGCDLASANNTLILNANSSTPLRVQHRFEYERSDATNGGNVEVLSMLESESLESILANPYGVSRSDVVSARVDSVVVDPVSTAALTGANLYLGTDASGPRIASVQFAAGDASAVVDKTPRSVTSAVQQGSEEVFGQFQVSDPDDIPSSGGVVRATVYYRVEAE